MKKYLVIGNPIEHSLSPKLHNHWIKQNNIDAVYEKKQLNESDIEGMIDKVRSGKIDGINVTVPFKESVIPFLTKLTPLANETQSVNTIYREDENGVDTIVGDNTDVGGFIESLKHINYNVKNKEVFILGAGGVVPSIFKALEILEVGRVVISNRTRRKAEELQKQWHINVRLNKIINWGQVPDYNMPDMIINATSLGLKKDDQIELDYKKLKPKFFAKKKLFYDLIYNPKETNFLKKGKELGQDAVNGKMMFIYQARLAFKIWHNILPKINDETFKLLD